jgi:hypothetical protein
MMAPPGRPKTTETPCCLKASNKHLAPDITVKNYTSITVAQHATLSSSHAGLLNKDNNEERKDYGSRYRQGAKRVLGFECQRSFRTSEISLYTVVARFISLSRPAPRTPQPVRRQHCRCLNHVRVSNLSVSGFEAIVNVAYRPRAPQYRFGDLRTELRELQRLDQTTGRIFSACNRKKVSHMRLGPLLL